ncbi:MAG: LamB/YcsF family protein [Opitutales bacterium]
MGRLLINCDLGENETDEQTEKLLGLVDAASICCGEHAGSGAKTRRTLQMAAERGIMVGVHPGLAADGGRGGQLPGPAAFRELLDRQITRFTSLAGSLGLPVAYLKLHGSLYHAVEADEAYAAVYLEWLHEQAPAPGVFALAGGGFAEKAKAAGLKVWREAFADRGYRSNGTLVPRAAMGAVLDAATALARFKKWQGSGLMATVDARPIALQADTFCVHSDSPDAETLLAGLKNLSSV